MAKKTPDKAHSMWGGRFESSPDAATSAINLSLTVDKRLYREDIAGSRAYAAELRACGLLSPSQAAAIERGLCQALEEIETQTFPFDEALEDIHMNIEARLIALIGEDGARVHTGRSRNDQVATDLRLWLRNSHHTLQRRIADLQRALLAQAENTADWAMPGFTHLQNAQPVTFAHHCLAYCEMLARDRARMKDAVSRANECPLGAGALAGSAFPLDRHRLAQSLGFDKAMANSLDAVSARDFVLEWLAILAILATHLSRLAEDIVLWCSTPFGFARIGESTSTGSSIMPQKRNPDGAELARAKSGRLFGNLIALLTVMKALPLAYSKDMQEDKAFLFDSFDHAILALNALSATIAELRPCRERMEKALEHGFVEATDLADWLVRKHDVPFRKAHALVGSLVKRAEALGLSLCALPLSEAQALVPMVTRESLESLTVEEGLAKRALYGGTAPARVREQIAHWQQQLDE